jgi:plastocyanin
MYVLPAGIDNTAYRASERTITLPPYGGRRIEDPLASQWGLRGLAAIYLESAPAPGIDGAFIVESRVLNVANPDATFGLSLPAATGGLEPGDVGYGADAQSDDRYRTNIGLLNNSAQTTVARVELVNDDGTILGTREFALAPYSLLHTNIKDVTAAPFARATVRVIPDAALSGELIGYLSIVDGTTGDGTFSPLRPYRNVAQAGAVVVTMQRYAFGPNEIRLEAGKTYRLVFRAVDVAHGVTAVPQLGIDANDSIEAGAEYVAEITPTAAQRGRYNIACTRVCGAGHGTMTAVIEVM